MQKLIILLLVLLAIAMGSCEQRIESVRKEQVMSNVDVLRIDSCEYVVYHNINGNSIIHKGNCKNPIHKP